MCIWVTTDHFLCFSGKYGIPHPAFFCLKPSYWMRSRRGCPEEGPHSARSPEEPPGDDVEPVPAEFMGKEAIRSREEALLIMPFAW